MLLLSTSVALLAQVPVTQKEATLIVGLLTGDQDPRQLVIRTAEGDYPVLGVGNSKPFRLQEENVDRLTIVFLNHPAPANTPSQVSYRFFASERSLITAVILDEIDYAHLESETAALEIAKGTKNYRIFHLSPPLNTVELIAYNLSNPWLRDHRLRYALSHGIDKKKIKREIVFDKADIARGAYDRQSDFYTTLREFKYDPKLAMSLLEEAGWTKSTKDRIRYRSGRPLRLRLFFREGIDLAEKIVRQIKLDCIQLGIDIVPVPLSASAINDSIASRRFDAVLLRHQFDDSAFGLAEYFGEGAGGGIVGYQNREYQHTYRLAKTLQKEADIRIANRRMQTLINDDQPVTFLFHPWVEFHFINVAKFESYLDAAGLPRQFEYWQLRLTP